ncbi:hypothetical protein NMY22_g16760 [Coprinellus aureogranulatus]|nr:hypothetical protein NMY22_g16760 [Coprinellus aureogranulatus]
MSAPSKLPGPSEGSTSNDNAPPTRARGFRWPLPRFLPAIRGGVLHAAITERILRAAQDAAREGRRRLANAEFNRVVQPMMDAVRRRHPERFGPQGPDEENDERGSEGGSPPPPGSPVPSDPPGVDDNFPEMRIVLLPNVEVAAFRGRRGVNDDRMAEHRVPGTEETLFCYSDTVEAWERVSEVSYILVLPRNRFLRFILAGTLKAPVASLVVLSGLCAILFKGLVAFIPAYIVYDFFLLPTLSLAKYIAYGLLYALNIVFFEIGIFAGYAFAVVGRGARRFLVAVLNIAVQYLDDLREAQVEQLAAL